MFSQSHALAKKVHANNLQDQSVDENIIEFEKVKGSLNFTGKVALVTGSDSGIGAETVRLLSYLGAQVVVTGMDEQSISEVAKQCQKLSPYNNMPLGVTADLTNKEGIKELIDQTMQTYGKIDILVNNAGILRRDEFLSKNFSALFSEVTTINEMAAIEVTRLAVPYLKQTNGTVIFIGSLAARLPLKNLVAYGVSKAAVVWLSKELSLELGPNIRVNTISPGIVSKTNLYGPDGVPEDLFNAVSGNFLGRSGVPLDIAKGIVFLASPLAEWISGINLAIDGGSL